MQKRSSYNLVYKYISREYLINFLLAFVFFFFIFFINQILLLAQKILIKNVSLSVVMQLLILAMPQFLLYTIPYSCLTAASMLIGTLSSQNEILAMRFSGINLKRIFYPILVISLLFAGLTFFIADFILPVTASAYKTEYKNILRDLPTLQIDSYSVNKIDNFILSNGLVEDNNINDIVILNSDVDNDEVIISKSGRVEVFDLDKYIYKLELDSPNLLSVKKADNSDYGFADANKTTVYLDFSSEIPSVQATTPSQLSIKELLKQIEVKNLKLEEKERTRYFNISSKNSIKAASDLAWLKGETVEDIPAYFSNIDQLNSIKDTKITDFYVQYYKSELYKKIALSLACICLVVMAFPISFTRIKYGRLVGFGLSILVAVSYWFMLFYLQLKSIDIAINPIFLMLLPDVLFLAIGLILLWRLNKS